MQFCKNEKKNNKTFFKCTLKNNEQNNRLINTAYSKKYY